LADVGERWYGEDRNISTKLQTGTAMSVPAKPKPIQQE
jgi:hypothetical protein